MKSIAKKTILAGIAIIYSSILCNASSADSLAAPTDYRLLPMRNAELQLSNPTAYRSLVGSSMDLNLNYQYTTGDYKTVSDGSQINEGWLNIKGYKQIDNLYFYGDFSYKMAGIKDQNWKDVFMTSPNNPYILADSIGSDYDNEEFKIKGAMAMVVNEKLTWGLQLDYVGGSSADQTDPRPLIDAVRYTIRPGITYAVSPNWSAGLDFAYQGYSEKISIESLETIHQYRFFLMQGIGNAYVESSMTSAHSREYTGSIWDVNLQLHWSKNNLKNSLQLGFNNNNEKAEDGSSYIFKGGDYEEMTYSLTDVFTWQQGKSLHVAKITASRAESQGTWYDQERTVNSNNQTVWEVYNKSIKYKNDITKAQLDYSFVKQRNEAIDLLLGANVAFEENKTTYHPDLNSQEYSNLKLGANAIKTFFLPNKFQFETNLSVNYTTNLSESSNFVGINLATVYTQPIYDYLTSDAYGGALQLKLSKQTQISKRQSLIYVALKGDYMQSDAKSIYFDNDNRWMALATIGLTF